MAKTLLITDDALIIREIIKDTAEEAGWDGIVLKGPSYRVTTDNDAR